MPFADLEIESLWALPPSRRSDLPVLCKGDRGRHHFRKKAPRPGICGVELDGAPVQLSETFETNLKLLTSFWEVRRVGAIPRSYRELLSS